MWQRDLSARLYSIMEQVTGCERIISVPMGASIILSFLRATKATIPNREDRIVTIHRWAVDWPAVNFSIQAFTSFTSKMPKLS